MTMTTMNTPAPLARGATANRAGWLHLCNGLDPMRDGGMVPSILGMTGALAADGGDVRIVTPTPSRLRGVSVPPGVSLALEREAEVIESTVRASEVVHLHGLWQGHTRRGARAARRHGIPYMIAAHGMAEPWALRQKAWKKRIYTAVIEGNNLRRASCLQALTRPEIAHLRAIAPRTPICLVPNGVDLRPFDALPARSAFEEEYPHLAGKFLLLFLSRIHAKKGLDLLAPAMHEIRQRFPEVHLLLAGFDDGALAPFQAQAEALGEWQHVTYLGHVSGESARRAWGAANAFVLPSHSEGFSMAVLEALAARLPVLITESCHFPELKRAAGGVVVPATLQGVTTGLDELLSMSSTEQRELAERGRALVEARYTWAVQARRLADVYRWIAGGGPKPDSVEAR